MRIYTVHSLPRADALERPPILLREGFSWPAALLTGLWALWHGLWLAALLIFVAGAAVLAALGFAGANDAAVTVAMLGFALIVGFGANDWRRARLARQGYRLEGVVAATGFDAALRRWFDLHPPAQSSAAAPY